MKWFPAKAKTATLSLLFFAGVFSLGSFALQVEASGASVANTQSTAETQMGFYDLLSEQSEVYNVHVQKSTNSYIVSISMPDEPRFVLKGKIVVVNNSSGKLPHLDFTPIYYHNPFPNRMIDTLVDYTTHNDTLIQDINLRGKQLIVTRTGMVILLPEIFAIQFPMGKVGR